MTTIAIRKYKDRIELVADTQGSDDGIIFKKKKLYAKTDTNFIFVHCGNSDQGLVLNDNICPTHNDYSEEELYSYFLKINNKFSTDGADVEHFLVAFNKKIYDLRLNKSCVDFTEIQESFYAGGTGRNFALAAMDLGKSPKEAVQLAIKYDVYSGGDAQELIIKF